jgi:hypothetical protein
MEVACGLYRVITETCAINGQATYAAESGYDSVGNRTQVTNPGTGRQVTSSYYLARRLIQALNASTSTSQITTCTYGYYGGHGGRCWSSRLDLARR